MLKICCILISRIFQLILLSNLFPVFLVPLTNGIKIHLVLLCTLHNTNIIAYHMTEVLIFYAGKLMVMGNSKNLRVFKFAVLFKSGKFDTRKIYMFYNTIILFNHV